MTDKDKRSNPEKTQVTASGLHKSVSTSRRLLYSSFPFQTVCRLLFFLTPPHLPPPAPSISTPTPPALNHWTTHVVFPSLFYYIYLPSIKKKKINKKSKNILETLFCRCCCYFVLYCFSRCLFIIFTILGSCCYWLTWQQPLANGISTGTQPVKVM